MLEPGSGQGRCHSNHLATRNKIGCVSAYYSLRSRGGHLVGLARRPCIHCHLHLCVLSSALPKVKWINFVLGQLSVSDVNCNTNFRFSSDPEVIGSQSRQQYKRMNQIPFCVLVGSKQHENIYGFTLEGRSTCERAPEIITNLFG